MGEGAARVLRDGVGHVRLATTLAPVAWRPTGTAFDAWLGEGLPQGRIVEMVGAGRTGWAVHLVAALTEAGSVCAWVDPADRFDPRSAEAAGVVLERVLWVRPKGLRAALACIETLARVHGFAAIVGDLERSDRPGSRARLPWRRADRVTLGAWARLARAAEESGASVLLLGEAPQAGSFAAAAVTFHRRGARWAQNGPRAPRRLEGLLVSAETRSKIGPPCEAPPFVIERRSA